MSDEFASGVSIPKTKKTNTHTVPPMSTTSSENRQTRPTVDPPAGPRALAAMCKACGSRSGYDIVGHVVQRRDDFARTLFWRGRRGERTWWAVRDGDWKYVQTGEGSESLQWLFDLARNVGEQSSLLPDKQTETQRIQDRRREWEANVKAVRRDSKKSFQEFK